MVSRVDPAGQHESLPAQKIMKPLLRRSTVSGVVRKIDDLDMDSDMLSSPLSPRKKAKVTFNETVEEKLLEEYSRSLESVRREVKMSLEAHIRGTSDTGYDAIKEVFAPRRRDDEESLGNEEMRAYMLALTTHASLLNKSCAGLIRNLLAFEWMGRDERFVRAYIQFLGSLASTQGANVVDTILSMLADHFHGGKYIYLTACYGANNSSVKLSSGRLPGCPDVTRDELMLRVHSAMKYILHLIPSASRSLAPLLSAKFPSDDDNKTTHIIYIKNLLRLIEYAPELTSDALSFTTDRLVKIDVQMQHDLDDEEDDIVAAVIHGMSSNATNRDNELEEDMSDESDIDSDSSDDNTPIQTKRARQLQDKVEKMDSILDLLFTYYEPRFSAPDSLGARSLFDSLIQHFKTIIIPTYSSRHTQFLLFHYAQKSSFMIDRFAGTCIEIAFDKTRPAVLQQSAAAYLASFVARGKHVESDVVRTVFDAFGGFLDKQRRRDEAQCRGPNLQRYTSYYTMTQALIYIFCFRWRDLVISPELSEEDDPIAFINQDFTWAPGVREALTSAIYSKFNPLKVCCPPIVSEFAKIARHLRFMYIYPILEKNERIRLSQFAGSHASGRIRDSGVGGRSESWHQLDAQFPFDPYQLPSSKHWVEGDYVEWQALPGLEEEDDESEDEPASEEEMDTDDEEENTATDDENYD